MAEEKALNSESGQENKTSRIDVSFQFLLTSIVGSAFVAFSLGIGLLSSSYYPHSSIQGVGSSNSVYDRDQTNEASSNPFPNPLLIKGKDLPYSSYTSRHWQSESSASMASLYLKSEDDDDDQPKNTCDESYDGETQCTFIGSETGVDDETDGNVLNGDAVQYEDDDEDDDEDDEGDDEHLPAGQHLFIDIEHVNEEFLNSEVRLAEAMVEVASQSKLTLLSYHCHSLIPSGVSCVGVLLESHVSFHTWPSDGVITIDLFTCGSGKLVPVLPIVTKLFGIPRTPKNANSDTLESIKQPHVLWAHKLRGFRPADSKNFMFSDLGISYEDLNDVQEEIYSGETKFQRIDIIDENDSFYMAPEFREYYKKNRQVFLDGVQQSTLIGNEAYHEALVHPAMFAHYNPKRVAIIGGGECATLREVLKHNTVEHVKMIEIDEQMVSVSREHLPSWNSCSDIKGSADWCGDDVRADVQYMDALAWFIDNFGQDDATEYKEEKFDILIMDALDPQDDVPFAEILYTHDHFFKSMFNALTDEGILILQLGVAPYLDQPPDEVTKDSKRAYLSNSLENVGFQAIHLYEESHCDFGDPWTYLVAMKDSNTNALWTQNEARVNLAIHQRMLKTHSGTPTLKYFDGDTMKSYQTPSKSFEAVHCNKDPVPEHCIVTKEYDISIDDLEVKLTDPSDSESYGVFTKVDIKKGNTISRKSASQYVHIPPLTFERMNEILESSPDAASPISDVMHFLEGYGRQTTEKGKEAYFVDSSILQFISHGCSGTNNLDDQSGFIESTGDIEQDFDMLKSTYGRDVFDPFLDRHLHQWINSPNIALRDIEKGEELLKNYLIFAKDKESWLEDVKELRESCL